MTTDNNTHPYDEAERLGGVGLRHVVHYAGVMARYPQWVEGLPIRHGGYTVPLTADPAGPAHVLWDGRGGIHGVWRASLCPATDGAPASLTVAFYSRDREAGTPPLRWRVPLGGD